MWEVLYREMKTKFSFFKDTYTTDNLYHFILFLLESTNYGDNLDRVLDPKSVMNR